MLYILKNYTWLTYKIYFIPPRLITDDKVDAAEPAAEPAAESAKVQPKSTNPPNQTSSPTYSW